MATLAPAPAPALRVTVHTHRSFAEILSSTGPLEFTMIVRGVVGSRTFDVSVSALQACDSDTARLELIVQRAYEAHTGVAAANVADASCDFECDLYEALPRITKWLKTTYERSVRVPVPELGVPRVLHSDNGGSSFSVKVV